MKTSILSLILVLSLSFVGCSGLSKRAQVAATLEGTQITVNVAMNEYGKMFRANKLKEPAITQVRTGHAKYRVAFDVALVAAEFDYKSATPDNVQVLADAVITLVQSLNP